MEGEFLAKNTLKARVRPGEKLTLVKTAPKGRVFQTLGALRVLLRVLMEN